MASPMQPKDLKPPFTWKERRVELGEGLLFVPPGLTMEEYASFDLPPWRELTGHEGPIALELCSGNGDWIVQKARENPGTLWLALEKRFDRCRKIWSKRANGGIANLFIVCGEAKTITEHYFKQPFLSSVWVNFPDPWPKNRHAKNRLIVPSYLSLLQPALLPRGSFTVATDDFDACQRMSRALLQQPRFTPCLSAPYYTTDYPAYGSSYFERLWKEKGRTLYYLQFVKEGPDAIAGV